eukprot:1016815-Pyramimonas_sp.AAC.1
MSLASHDFIQEVVTTWQPTINQRIWARTKQKSDKGAKIMAQTWVFMCCASESEEPVTRDKKVLVEFNTARRDKCQTKPALKLNQDFTVDWPPSGVYRFKDEVSQNNKRVYKKVEHVPLGKTAGFLAET